MTVLSKRRSNRPLTEFACRLLNDFVLTKNKDSFQSEQKNTTVRVVIDGQVRQFIVLLYEEEIFRLTFVASNGAASLKLSFTSFYDAYGQPSSTTAERLNGLLDTLGVLGILPKGVRIFRDQEYYTTYLGKGDEKVTIGENLFTSVYIKPDREKLIFAGYVSSPQAEEQ